MPIVVFRNYLFVVEFLFLCSQPTVLPLLHPPSTNPPRQETDRQREITRGVDSATEEMRRLRPEVEREGQSPQLVSSGVQTDATLLTSHSEDSGTDEEHSLPLAGNPEGVETAGMHNSFSYVCDLGET